jgi:hypothetical protein
MLLIIQRVSLLLSSITIDVFGLRHRIVNQSNNMAVSNNEASMELNTRTLAKPLEVKTKQMKVAQYS